MSDMTLTQRIAELERQKQALAAKQKEYEAKIASLTQLEARLSSMFAGIQEQALSCKLEMESLFGNEKQVMAKELGIVFAADEAAGNADDTSDVVRPQEDMLRPTRPALNS